MIEAIFVTSEMTWISVFCSPLKHWSLCQILFCELEWFPSYMLTGDRKFLFTFDCIWYRVVEHSSNGYIHNTFLHLRLREHWGQVQRDCKSQEIKEFAVRLCHLVVSEATPTRSHQHDCLNLSWTTSIDTPQRTESSQGLSPTQRNTGN